jgi:hypothetical protein
VLLSSYAQGLFEIEPGRAGVWSVADSFRAGAELPGRLFGDAQYLAAGGVAVIVLSRGVVLVHEKRPVLLGPADGLHGNQLLRLLARRSGDLWIAFSPQPFGRGAGAALQVLRDGRVVHTTEVAQRELATIGRWVEVPERNSVFAATRAGVVEIDSEGRFVRLSTNSASSITREPRTGLIAAVGTTIERWNGRGFVPVLFDIHHPRSFGKPVYLGAPSDIAIDRSGTWYVLFPEGVVALLDSRGRPIGVLDREDGIPPTAARLLADPRTGQVVVGSQGEGVVVIQGP